MRRRFLILCFACLALLFVGCGQESTVYSGGLPEIEAPSSESKRPESVSSSEKVLSSSSSSENSLISYGKLVDKRNDAVYRTVKIGEQTWMAENLNYETEYSFCYNDSLENCEMYGRLYYWSAAMDSAGEYGKNARGCGFRSGCDVVLPVRGVCPEGWHLPSSSDVKVLAAAAGGMAVAGKMLKSVNNWIYGGGFDMYGFSMLPSGARNDNGGYLGLGSYAYFWTTNYVNDGVKTQADVFEFDFDKNQTTVLRYLKNGAMSVRCVKDDSSEKDTVSKTQPNIILGSFTDSRDDQKYKTVTIGEQVWMAQNLNYECKKSYCYNNSFDGCDRFGRFYDWSTAQNVCPKGWHLPGKKEWNELFAEVGGAKNAGLVLRADSVWRRENRGSDAYGFFALPAGFRDYSGMYSGGASSYNDEYAFFWTSARKNDSYSYYVFMTSGASETGFSYSDKNDYRSVRCVRDEPASSSSEKVSSSSEKVSSSSVKSSSSVSPTSSSGRLSHYCNENAGFSCEDTYSWVGGNEEQTIYRYNGDTTEIVPAGRFFIIMECVLTVEERSLLAEHGFVKVGSVTPSRGKDFVLYSSETDTKKAFLDSLLLCFFNTVGADDTSRIDVEILPEDISSDSTVNMYIFCWGDVDVNVCAETVANCGGTDIGVARGFLVSTVPVDSVECLSTSRNITGLEVEREMPVCSPPLPDE